ncbi:hypothetical protein [Streptosporangium sp. NPDC001681]|uniref:glycine-rich domain-containing protein n=1 Tax=Streptosporangium sp. NPDC001681 TaxID=3154395 RepID=UPI00332EACBB
MAVVVQLTAGELANPRTLIPDQLFGYLTDRVAREEDIPQQTAEQIVEQALAFLVACGRNSDVRLFPSKLVDVGWHTFILYTRPYAEFCQKVAGRFIHHVPTDIPEHAPPDRVAAIGVTVETMRATGLPVVPELWTLKTECSQCYQGCADDPRES